MPDVFGILRVRKSESTGHQSENKGGCANGGTSQAEKAAEGLCFGASATDLRGRFVAARQTRAQEKQSLWYLHILHKMIRGTFV